MAPDSGGQSGHTGRTDRLENKLAGSAAQVRMGDQPATAGYAGLAPGAVGLYQFNLVVPNVSGAVPLTFHQAGRRGQQKLYVAVQ